MEGTEDNVEGEQALHPDLAADANPPAFELQHVLAGLPQLTPEQRAQLWGHYKQYPL